MMKSLFRPRTVPGKQVLDDHHALVASIERRGLLRGGLSLGALTMLTGCDVGRPEAVESALQSISSFNDGVQAFLFDPNKLAPTYPESMVLKPPTFNAYYDVADVKPIDGASWRLELAGLIADKKPWSGAQIATLPETDMIIRHVCVEGWDYIGQWSGVRLRTFLERVGADLKARYVVFQTADNYPSIIDMATALHPQTLLATKYAKEILPDLYGYPLRLRMATKLGYKNPKWITAIEVTNSYKPGYWEQKGFNFFGGI
ncbi:molybdopterin-dependent oxidoreductase [Beijerinckia sp. L45]|uniref:molybdopterin-dependent oxidoreductase n=1 Tax=Beijerinckia sp. L45 TaxID=1641855 RepID=UPI001FEDC515|nr:molybdopterin-dependent oxidoreductase [Beijerinckia sp. L45]